LRHSAVKKVFFIYITRAKFIGILFLTIEFLILAELFLIKNKYGMETKK
jgi:hypothetical protein